MQQAGMDDWTKKEDMEADQRCPDSCFWNDCDREAVVAVALGYDFGDLYGAPSDGEFKWTPWQYFCEGCAERYDYKFVLNAIRARQQLKAEVTGEES